MQSNSPREKRKQLIGKDKDNSIIPYNKGDMVYLKYLKIEITSQSYIINDYNY